MRVVDSSAWIEWLLESPTGNRLGAKMPAREKCIVPTIVQLELAKWLGREIGEAAVDNFFAFTARCIVIPLDTALARSAAEIAASHKLAIADAIIYATGLQQGADILTCDAHFNGLRNVVYIQKHS